MGLLVPGLGGRNYTYGIYPSDFKDTTIPFWMDTFQHRRSFLCFPDPGGHFQDFSAFSGLLFKKKLNRQIFCIRPTAGDLLFPVCLCFFQFVWGLNYNRKGIAYQLDLDVKRYTLADLDTLTSAIQEKLNDYAILVTEEQRDSFNRKKNLFKESREAYQTMQSDNFHFWPTNAQSVKPSLFSYLGNYLGFQGYYNPFSGEAQVNTTIPRFLEPFVTAHEIAHQLGYAKENEANFVAFLACRYFSFHGISILLYFDMYNYAVRRS